MKTLYLFIDESGNFDFSPKGTKYFVLTCVSTYKPVEGRDALVKLRYDLLAQGINQEFFHATEDLQSVRNQVFTTIKNLEDDIEVDSVIAQKNKTHPSLFNETYTKKGKIINRVIGTEFYQVICRTLLQYVFRRPNFRGTEKIVVILGSIFTNDKQSMVLKALKTYLKSNFSIPFEIYFHCSQADLNCQLADYIGWAITIKWERDEERSYNLIKDKVRSTFEIFQRGSVTYYEF